MRPIYCDGNGCPDLPPGQHSDDCFELSEEAPRNDDIVWATAMEDGAARRPLLTGVPAQQGRSAL
ncbi:hypothetical protein [Streptomyces sp. MI02-7b]|uniref:hypothetical protein n=1 Tax=Streptomyces sp. MI02-7b TaxID=462941 RepID=UPI0029B9F44D|nr:hypothetical protein [Streptomyces sp. MI02-7b]MDX3074584.1 hypothetical protein [Streptomyces sp. MI02-7b]